MNGRYDARSMRPFGGASSVEASSPPHGGEQALGPPGPAGNPQDAPRPGAGHRVAVGVDRAYRNLAELDEGRRTEAAGTVEQRHAPAAVRTRGVEARIRTRRAARRGCCCRRNAQQGRSDPCDCGSRAQRFSADRRDTPLVSFPYSLAIPKALSSNTYQRIAEVSKSVA